MAKVSYEILTKVKKTYHYKKLRSYIVTAQIIVKEMSDHNFHQLNIPVNGTGMAVFLVVEHIPTRKELTPIALKQAITKRLNAVKVRYEKKLQPEKGAVILTVGGNYKDVLSTIEGLSV